MMQKRQIKPKEPIPEFKNAQEEAEFWDTHDVGEYLNDFNRVDVELQLEKPKEENIVVRVQKPIKERLERIARRKGLTFPYRDFSKYGC
jgi:DNA/RNA-binding domain of Phe-tRNA-synthetase-like protein